jgi:hypothetical protein
MGLFSRKPKAPKAPKALYLKKDVRWPWNYPAVTDDAAVFSCISPHIQDWRKHKDIEMPISVVSAASNYELYIKGKRVGVVCEDAAHIIPPLLDRCEALGVKQLVFPGLVGWDKKSGPFYLRLWVPNVELVPTVELHLTPQEPAFTLY